MTSAPPNSTAPATAWHRCASWCWVSRAKFAVALPMWPGRYRPRWGSRRRRRPTKAATSHRIRPSCSVWWMCTVGFAPGATTSPRKHSPSVIMSIAGPFSVPAPTYSSPIGATPTWTHTQICPTPTTVTMLHLTRSWETTIFPLLSTKSTPLAISEPHYDFFLIPSPSLHPSSRLCLAAQ